MASIQRARPSGGPYGNADYADRGKPGDYSKHELKTLAVSALPVTAGVEEVDLPEAKPREIFYELTAAQDRGVGAREAYRVVARHFGVETSIVDKIAIEGAVKGWPMPPPPRRR